MDADSQIDVHVETEQRRNAILTDRRHQIIENHIGKIRAVEVLCEGSQQPRVTFATSSTEYDDVNDRVARGDILPPQMMDFP